MAPATKGSIPYGEHLIHYSIRHRTNRKSSRVAIHVDPDGFVWVDAPDVASEQQIRASVARRARWIYRHLVAIRLRRAQVFSREYVSGETVLYLGRRYRLKVIAEQGTPAGVKLRGGYFEVLAPTSSPKAVMATIDHWYRERALSFFLDRLNAISESLVWVRETPAVRLRTMNVRWGSCSPAGRLTLNPNLVKLPRECVDYVLLHELCHLKEHNHGKKFYRLLDAHLPDWRRIKDRMDALADVALDK
jgi:predicted metal-dependent hydrolase